jgi:hypothetical protein
MRVATIQEAIEGAPTLIQLDGDGGVTFTLVTDEAILSVVQRITDDNNWNEEERDGLYRAVCETLEFLGGVPADGPKEDK